MSDAPTTQYFSSDDLFDKLVGLATEGCCRNPAWRGRSCLYHEGYEDGVEAALRAIAELVPSVPSEKGEKG